MLHAEMKCPSVNRKRLGKLWCCSMEQSANRKGFLEGIDTTTKFLSEKVKTFFTTSDFRSSHRLAQGVEQSSTVDHLGYVRLGVNGPAEETKCHK